MRRKVSVSYKTASMLIINLLLLTVFFPNAYVEVSVEPNVPDPIVSNEEALVNAIGQVEPVGISGGHQQFDLEIATVATWEGKRQLGMRLWVPAKDQGANKPHPVAAYVHGGAFAYGSHELDLEEKSGFSQVIRTLLDSGIAVASLDYRLAGEAGWPAQLRDTKCGLRYLRTFGKHWDLNTEKIVVLGHSAGARITALLGLVEDDPWHTGLLPWREVSAQVQGIHLFAGSAYTLPEACQWWEYVRPTQYSVPKMLFGEHPEMQESTRRRLRIRHQAAHLAGDLPPLRMVRGVTDYGGNHRDARKTIEVWRSLGQEADLSVVAGGHGAIGNIDEVVSFCRKHLSHTLKSTIRISPVNTAMKLLEIGEAKEALSVLVQAYDPSTTKGEWIILNDRARTMLWVPDTSGWPSGAPITLKHAACAQLAGEEAAQIGIGLVNKKPGLSPMASHNAAVLGDGMSTKLLAAQALGETEANLVVLKKMYEASILLEAGDLERAKEKLRGEDARLQAAKNNLLDSTEIEKPNWALHVGTDIYGKWAELALVPGKVMRFRYIPAGTWELSSYLRWQTSEDKPAVIKLQIENDLWVAEREVTVEQWCAIMGDTLKEADLMAPSAGHEYNDILSWLYKVNQKNNRTFLRLPTEGEWLHASMAGGKEAVWGPIQAHRSQYTPIIRGDGIPNLAGLIGMIGGVQEWTATSGRGYAEVTLPDGKKAVWGYPIARGGGWGHPDQIIGPDVRTRQHPGNIQPDLGFRPVIDADDPAYQWLEWLKK